MDTEAQVVCFQYSVGRRFLGAVREDRATGGNELRQFGGKGVAIVLMLFLLERRGDDKAMCFFHDLKLLLKGHDDAMMGEAICMD